MLSTTFDSSILSYRPSKLRLGGRTRKALPQPVGVTYAIVRARRTLAALQLPASSLILHLSLIHSLPPATIHSVCRIVQPTSPLRGRMLIYWIPG